MQFEKDLILALEIYLTKGYFPSWLNGNISKEQIITSLIQSSPNDLKQMIKKHSSNESVIARLKHHLDSKIFEEIYPEMESMSLEVMQKLAIEDELQLESSISHTVIDIYKKEIMIHYLDFGYLPKEFRNLNKIDVQNIFMELIQLKDSFLVDKFNKNNNHRALCNRIRLLITNDMQQYLNDYLRYFFDAADKYILDIKSGFQNDIVGESNNLEIEELKSSAHVHLSTLAFYAHNEFFPWWTKTANIGELININFNESQLLGNSFETICLVVEKENQFMEPLVSILSNHLIEVFSNICSQHVQLRKKWEGILSLFEHEKDKKGTSLPKLRGYSLSKVFNEGAKENHILKPIYLIRDEEILNQSFGNDYVKKEQLLSYLKLAPYLYFQDINPAKWRLIVYTFASGYYNLNQNKTNQEFSKAFMNFLIEDNNTIPWKDLFKTIYKKIRVTEATPSGVFPNELLQLLRTEANKDKKIKFETPENTNECAFDDIGAEIKIYNSGLFILWPFLTRYFEQLSLVKNEKFVNEESKNRAVYLLQYLAFDSINFPEYELILNKLIVGLPIERHLSPIVDLTKDEKDLSESLLNGLKANWDRVKSSSIEALQETFLQREGILSINEQKVTLRIEKKGVDVLLDNISWNITLFKLPWMQKPLYVEWI